MRTLLTPRWIAYLLLAVMAATVMVFLGRWQWSRYELRHEINARIDASTTAQPLPLASVLPGPGVQPPKDAAWTRTTVTGRYDPAHEILIRGRTVDGRVGYEVLTPLIADSGTAVLVDRGWVAPAEVGMTVAPDVPPPPAGTVTVTGRVHLSESGGGEVAPQAGVMQTRRVNVPAIEGVLPYPVEGAYLLADEGAPGAEGLVPIPVAKERDWLNFGYAFQWWIFAAGALVAFVWLARREVRGPAEGERPGGDRTGGDRTSAPAGA